MKTSFLCLWMILGPYCFLVGQSLQDTIYRDRVNLGTLMEELNTQTREERGGDPFVIIQMDSALRLSESLRDTSQSIDILWMKRNWLLDNNRDILADSTTRQRSVLQALYGYTMDETPSEDPYYTYEQVQNSMMLLVDPSSSIPFDSIISSKFQPKFIPNALFTDRLDSSATYWVRMRLKGNGSYYQEHLLLPNANHELWGSVGFYRQDVNGNWSLQKGGGTVPTQKRITKNWRDLYKVETTAHSDFVVYFQLQGFKGENQPTGIFIRHIFADFLIDNARSRTFTFIFIGILAFQFFFFLLWSLATKERAFLPYLLYILSIIAIALCSIQFMHWFPYPDFDRNNNLVLIELFLSWIAGMSIILFTQGFINTSKIAPVWHKVLNIFMVIYSLVAMFIILPLFPYFLGFIEADSWFLSILENVYGDYVNLFIRMYIFLFALGLIFISITGWKAWKKDFKPAMYYLVAISLLVVGVGFIAVVVAFDLDPVFINSMEQALFVVQASIILQLGFFALGLGNKRRALELESMAAQNRLLDEQAKVNSAFGRFVPHKFLEAIGRDSVLDIKLGDGVEREVTVFFSDIRGYTQLAEQMKPGENFRFLNGYLGRMGPIISSFQGFVNQYYGDGIMAIFMQEPEDALKAALEIQRRLKQYNQERRDKNRQAIRIGIGLHTGPLIMGVIGDTLRMEAGVVSDTVNTASRMEGLTKYFGTKVLVSETVFREIQDVSIYGYRFLGKVQVKGRKEPIKVYDFFDGDEIMWIENKLRTKKIFDTGVEAYFNKEFVQAAKAFDEVLAIMPDDRTSINYLEKCKDFILHGIEEDWSGVEEVHIK